MAPRGRSKKGNMRIDAAIDALSQFGFSKDVVCKTIKDLLEVYGGDDGWPFIEEASYKLAIDTILEKDVPKEQDDGGAGHESEVGVDGDASSHPDEALANTPSAGPSKWKDIPCTDHGSSSMNSVVISREIGCSSSVSLDQSIVPLVVPSRPTREPCYGWISDDEDGADCPIHGTAAPLLLP